ncbi:MAG: putative nonspecific lipid-transfer protein [Frankiales bacterium]|jgi:acetyl-CoA acetyltransferase|nr:putative nonspecific lipid-transfer protein [Frankiales bacterium]
MNRLLQGSAVVGIGRTKYARASGRTALSMAAEAARDALADCGLTPADVDGFTCFGTSGTATPSQVAHAIGVPDLGWSLNVSGGGNIVTTTVAGAATAVLSGQADVVVVYRVLGSETRYGKAAGPITVGGEAQFAGPQGYLVPPQWFAMFCRRHQYEYGSTSEDLGAIAVQQRQHAARNPHAVGRDPITLDDYLNSRWINEPFRLFDCCYEVDGAVAIVVTSAERAADLPHKPVYLLGAADSNRFGGSVDQWDDMTSMFSRDTAPKLWSRTGLKASDIDVACMYDCFTFTVMATFEDFGFCAKGEVGDYFRAGRATYGGDVVVNPHGGLLSEGYIHGMNHHYEAVLQLRGDAGERQVAGAETALVTSGAGPFGGALVYGTATL